MRRLNSVERAWHIIGKHGSANAMRSFRISGPLSRRIVAKAFNGVLEIYPILCCSIVHDGKSYRFTRSQTSLPKIIFYDQLISPRAHHELTAELINTAIDPECMPLVQFVLARINERESWIYLNFHHAISDGMTTIALMQCFLSLCDALMESESTFAALLEQLRAQSATLSPSLTDSFKPRGVLSRTTALLRFIRRRALRQAAYSDISPKSSRAGTELENHVSNCAVFETTLPTRYAQDVLKIAKQNGLTLHELVTAALLQSIRSVLFSLDRRPGFSCITFVNLRNRCTPAISPQAIGCYVSAAFSFHHVSETTDLIELARDISRQIKHAIDSEIVEQATYASWMAKTLLAVGKKNIATLSISNIGLVSQALASKHFTVHEVHVHSALSGIGSAVSVGLTSTNENLSFDFTFLKQLATTTEIETIFYLTKQRLDEFIAAHANVPKEFETQHPPRRSQVHTAQLQ